MNEELSRLIERYGKSPEFSSTVWVNVNARSVSRDTLLHAAVIQTDRVDVKVLIALGADVNAAGDLGNTPLHEAASRGLVEIIRILVAGGARTNTRNEFGQTPGDLARLMLKDSNLKDAIRALNGR